MLVEASRMNPLPIQDGKTRSQPKELDMSKSDIVSTHKKFVALKANLCPFPQ